MSGGSNPVVQNILSEGEVAMEGVEHKGGPTLEQSILQRVKMLKSMTLEFYYNDKSLEHDYNFKQCLVST